MLNLKFLLFDKGLTFEKKKKKKKPQQNYESIHVNLK